MTDNENFTDSLTIPSTTDQVAKADEFLEALLRKIGVPEDTIANLAIAVTELVNNAIKHGNKLQKDKTVTVKITYKSGKIEITITDEGEGFNWKEMFKLKRWQESSNLPLQEMPRLFH